jgi:hypothetical protein
MPPESGFIWAMFPKDTPNLGAYRELNDLIGSLVMSAFFAS